MLGEIIAIGNELTSGRIINTTSGFAAQQLFSAGYDIYAMHTIGDTPTLIGEALKRAIGRVDFVIVTGGLGATDDDLTTEAVSEALGRPTLPNMEILSIIRAHLDETSQFPGGSLEKLAWLPQGAEALNPRAKMAGYQLIHKEKPIFFLPGIPRQMQILLIDHVLPRLATWSVDRKLRTCQRVFKIFDLEEAEINRRILELKLSSGVHIGYYPVFPEVHLSLVVRDKNNPKPLFQTTCQAIYEKMGSAIYGHDLDSLESIVGSQLLMQKKTLAVAESCTGGLISHRLTRIPGSSGYFLGGVTAYANSMKEAYLDVPGTLLESHGAVSSEVAQAMAIGIRQRSGSDFGISVTGIAGPDGGSDDKPVGTVYIGLSSPEKTLVTHCVFSGDRDEIQTLSAHTALDIMRRDMLTP